MEFHIASIKTKLEPGTTGFWGGFGLVVVLQHHGHTTPSPVLWLLPGIAISLCWVARSRGNSSQSKTCREWVVGQSLWVLTALSADPWGQREGAVVLWPPGTCVAPIPLQPPPCQLSGAATEGAEPGRAPECQH